MTIVKGWCGVSRQTADMKERTSGLRHLAPVRPAASPERLRPTTAALAVGCSVDLTVLTKHAMAATTGRHQEAGVVAGLRGGIYTSPLRQGNKMSATTHELASLLFAPLCGESRWSITAWVRDPRALCR